MRRPQLMAIVLAGVLGASTALAARQADEAWLLLTTGERVDGLVTGAPARGQVFDRNGFMVDEGNGRVTRIPVSQVALIDFTTRRPTNDELASLPATGQVLVLNDGTTRPGRLLDLTANTVRWQPVRGAAMNVSTREVQRIYLNLDRSYELAQGTGAWGQRRPGFARGRGTRGGFGRGGNVEDGGNVAGGAGGDRGFGRAGDNTVDGGGNRENSRSVAVLADQAWTDSDLVVRANQQLRFEAEGRVIFSLGNENITGPDGRPGQAGARFPVPAMGVGGLIGKVGATGRPFAIGARSGAIRMPATGRLFLGVNDDHYDDNSGAFRVTVIP